MGAMLFYVSFSFSIHSLAVIPISVLNAVAKVR